MINKGEKAQLIDVISETLRSKILGGELVPDTKLSENKVAEEFHCSRTPVREAFKRLEQDNLIYIQAHSGTYVKGLTTEEDIEITEARAAIESMAFRLACARKADTTILRTLCEQMETMLRCENVDFLAYGRTHYLFHRHLVELSGNKCIMELYNHLNLNSSSRLIYHKMNIDEMDKTIYEHQCILSSLERGDAENGVAFMFNHLWNKRERLFASISNE